MIHKKRITGIIVAGILLIASLNLSGCGSSQGATAKTGTSTSTVESVLEQGIAEAEEKSSEEEEPVSEELTETEDQPSAEVLPEPEPQPEESPEEAVSEADESVDVDLTVLSSTMVYTEVYNMMMSPDDYIGKKIKMKGLLSVYYDAASDKTYFACIIQDATACCSQGIEFVLTDEYRYPDDYPEPGEEICVAGTFETYTEGDYIFMNLTDARIAG